MVIKRVLRNFDKKKNEETHLFIIEFNASLIATRYLISSQKIQVFRCRSLTFIY